MGPLSIIGLGMFLMAAAVRAGEGPSFTMVMYGALGICAYLADIVAHRV